MAEEFKAGVCGSTWWSSSRSSLGLLPCSTTISDHMGGFGWPSSELVDMKARSSDESGSVSDGSTLFRDIQKPQHPDSGDSVWMDSSLQMMGISLSSPSSATTTDWNQSVLSGSGRSESNYNSPMLQEDMDSRLNFRQVTRVLDSPQIQKDWSVKNFSVAGAGGQNSTINGFNQTNEGFSLDEPCLNPVASSGNSTTTTCQDLPASFPMSSFSYGSPSTLLQTLFDTDHPQPHQSLFNNQSLNYPSTANYQTNLNEFSPSSTKLSPNNTPFWNPSTASLNDVRARFFPSTQTQFDASTFEEKPSRPKAPHLTAKANSEVVQDSYSVGKKSCGEPVFKRQRIETPSPLPTFKVRKEKLGDRVTALQQLVSPFGKTDTASVLQEAIEYIKFLHDQVSVLSIPYMKNGASIQHQQTSDELKNTEGPKQDLRSRGLCLVPISSTFPVANETTVDFWTPTFGGTFR